MGFLTERASYLRGLADGLRIDDKSDEGRLLKEIIELLDDIAGSVEDLEELQRDMEDEAANTDDRLNDLEDEVFGYEEEEDCYCPYCGEYIDPEEAELNEDCTAIICPSCGKEIELEDDEDDDLDYSPEDEGK
ncbi:MAG: hypothetical protein II748_02620 [Clostridia bacterium]|jgi:DNA repair exonuclease SbcCD ATPase subunit|nr:hypothetical protein [Clostridia bacterium]